MISTLRNTQITKPMLSVVATAGLPFTSEVNDGVVTLSSATAMSGPEYVKSPVNHFEVLMDTAIAEKIGVFLDKEF